MTGLSSPPRQQALRNAHEDELEEDISDLIFALLGKGVHKVLEDADASNDATITERRFYMRVPGPLGEWVVSGAMDSIELDADGTGGVVIRDWKTAKVAEMMYGVKEEREQQLNVYKVLLEANGYKVIGLQDIFLLRDWSKIQASREPAPVATLTGTQPERSYPESQVVVHEVRIWSPQEAAQFIVERVALHQQAQAEYTSSLRYFEEGQPHPQSSLPFCTDDERWAREKKFAVVKKGNTRATTVRDTREEAAAYAAEHTTGFEYTIEQRGEKWAVKKADGTGRAKLCDTREEAIAYSNSKADTYDVVERPAESIRCMYFCNVSAICEQYRGIREARANG